MEGFFHYILRGELDCHFFLLFFYQFSFWNYFGHWILPWFWGCTGEIKHRTVREGSSGSLSILPAFSTEDMSHRRERPVHRHHPASLVCSSLPPWGALLWPLGLGAGGAWHTVALFPSFLWFLTDLHSKTRKFSSEWVFISGSKL